MPLNPGSLTVTFSPPGNFVVDRLHTVPASQGLSPFDQVGSTIQTISVKDKVADTAYSEATNKVFTPFNANTDSVDAEWQVAYNGDNYRVMGVEKIPDAKGRVFQCLFMVKKETG